MTVKVVSPKEETIPRVNTDAPGIEGSDRLVSLSVKRGDDKVERLVTTDAKGISYPKVWQRSVDTPVTVRDVSPDADGEVIP